MSEQTRAQYYQAQKDDEGEWGEPERPPASSRRRLASMISVRFSPNEAQMIRQAAEAADESVSQFVRKAALQRCQPHRYLAPSVTATMQEMYRVQMDASNSPTMTEGGHEASNLTSRLELSGSSTAKLPAA